MYLLAYSVPAIPVLPVYRDTRVCPTSVPCQCVL